MKLNLQRPLVFFDIETTGVNLAKDRIVEICLLKIFPDGTEQCKTYLINPAIPIPQKTSAIHGIYDKDVQDAPKFSDVANEIKDFLENCDIAGYNFNKFDIPILMEEFIRVGIDFDIKNRKIIDVKIIFNKMESHSLISAYKFYCNKELENAHTATADTFATYEVLKAQLQLYEHKEYKDNNGNISIPIKNDIDALAEFTASNSVDFAGHLGYDENNNIVFNFGKFKGKPVAEIIKQYPSYYGWLMKADFPQYTKKVVQEIKEKLNVS